ncbi:MAG: hypothetical protein UX04_C0002G0085 [Microgenomates group bacterium GW2011_GWF2_45_18]|nr:MAG: hypothetical protein UW18_C0001G0012 [Microgenomates group bacterium GW2011_GWF1_44_10]KKU01942.1 MAG: hypothetical protein UX04_C0002G0085 [Microgenomates group bacterium GW2011_GWF2_45_18]
MRMQRIIWFLILCGIVSAFFVFLFSLPQSVQKYGFETKELTPSFAEREKGSEKISILITGDIMLGRSVQTRSIQNNSYTWPFEKIADTLHNADVVFINLESPFSDPCALTDSGMTFCTRQEMIAGLTLSGVDVASVANNHAMNQGKEGLLFTEAILQRNDILFVGSKETPMVIKNVKGTNIAFLAFNDVEQYQDLSQLSEETLPLLIVQANNKADIVIVMVHWGEEYTDHPTERQKKFAKLAVDAGADIVAGNHPHWTQPLEQYKNGWIVYSHGNFIFDQEWSAKTKQGVVSEWIVENKAVVEVKLLPVEIKQFGQVE